MPDPVSNLVPDFLPSTHGLHFCNYYPKDPKVPLFNIPVLGKKIPWGDASKGLCGGMVYTVRDYFEVGLPIPKDEQTNERMIVPPTSGKLFDHIASRLFDSFDLLSLPPGPVRYMHLMHPALPDGETWASNAGLMPRGRAWVMINEEWRLIKAELDSGHLSPMGLITIKSDDPFKMGENHQVLAYGYELTGQYLTLHIYDPNYPDMDNVTLSLSLADPQQPTSVVYTQNVGGDHKIWCFFHTNYTFSLPPIEEGLLLDVHLKASGGQYISANKAGNVAANRTSAGAGETFHLIDRNGSPLRSGDQIALQANNGKLVCVDDSRDREIVLKTWTIRDQEIFTILHADGTGGEIIDGQSVAFRARNGQFVCAETGGGQGLVANRTVIGPWETFKIEIVKPS